MTSETTAPAPPRPRLTLTEAADYLGVQESTLRYWRHQQTGPASYNIGHRVAYDHADLEAWLAAEKAKTVRGGIVA